LVVGSGEQKRYQQKLIEPTPLFIYLSIYTISYLSIYQTSLDAGPYYRSPQGLSVPYYYHPYAYRGYYYG